MIKKNELRKKEATNVCIKMDEIIISEQKLNYKSWDNLELKKLLINLNPK